MRHMLAGLLLLFSCIASAAPPSLRVAGTTWQLRWDGDGLVEYTPDGQADLERYSDMLTLLPTPADRGPADLEAYTREMVATHTRRGGTVLSERCEPAAAAHVADCTLVVAFTRPAHVEISVVKHLALRAGIAGFALSHREYGDGAGERARAWISSDAGQRLLAGYIDWVDATGLRMDTALPPRAVSAGEQTRDVGGVE